MQAIVNAESVSVSPAAPLMMMMPEQNLIKKLLDEEAVVTSLDTNLIKTAPTPSTPYVVQDPSLPNPAILGLRPKDSFARLRTQKRSFMTAGEAINFARQDPDILRKNQGIDALGSRYGDDCVIQLQLLDEKNGRPRIEMRCHLLEWPEPGVGAASCSSRQKI